MWTWRGCAIGRGEEVESGEKGHVGEGVGTEKKQKEALLASVVALF